MNGIFTANGKIWFAERMTTSFVCKGDNGLTVRDLKGNVLDWRIMNEEQTIEFPLPDHLFRFLFKPENLYAEKDLERKYQMSMAIQEGQPLADSGPGG